jgi:hypothetical protein
MSIFAQLSGGASYDLNAGITADVEPAVAAVSGKRLVLVGYSCRESAGSPAVAALNIVNGAAVSGGDAIIPIELAANGSEMKWFGPEGIATPDGLSIEVVAGTVDITLFYKQLVNA